MTHSEEKPYVCEKCNVIFAKEEHLIIHKETHKGEFHFVCGECKEVFTLQVDLEEHIQTHQHPTTVCSLGCFFKEEAKDETSGSLSAYLPVVSVVKSEIQSDNNFSKEPEDCENNDEFVVGSTEADNVNEGVAVKGHHWSQCDKPVVQKSTLTLRTIHKGEELFECDQRGKSFKYKRHSGVHLKTHTVERPFQCDQCEKTFKYKGSLDVHLRTHTGEKPFQCDQCEKTFTYKGDLGVHLRTHTGEKPFQCVQCDKAFAHKSTLTCHLRIHSGEKPFQCDQCDKSFRLTGNLNKHLKRHARDKISHDNVNRFECTQCKMMFRTTYRLRKHFATSNHSNDKTAANVKDGVPDTIVMESETRIDDNNIEESEEYEKNEEIFGGKSTEGNNFEENVVVKRHQCDQCDKTFPRKVDLIVHSRPHNGEKPFECDQCDRAFPRKGTLTRHLRTHGGEKPFQCDQCDKSFTVKGNLTRHLKGHTGEKIYHCDPCGEVFSLNSDLTKHLRTHTVFTEEKPFIIHKGTNKNGNGFVCGECKAVVILRVNLEKHIQ